MEKTKISSVLFIVFMVASVLSHGQPVVQETRNVGGFTKVAFGVPGNLFIKTGPVHSLTLEGSKRILDRIETRVTEGRLIIRTDNWKFSNNDERITINITMPEIEGLSVSGSGRIQVVDPVITDKLSLAVSGSGKLMISEMEVDNLNCGISGSGDIKIEQGSVDNAKVGISGSGSYSGGSVEIDHLDVSVSGSGSCYCKVTDSLNAAISGSGNVEYSGNPKVNARVSGSGHVRSK